MRHDYDKQADRKIILGPILKYAAIGITIGTVFITGTVTLEHRVNTFEQDISELKTQLARKNKEEQNQTTAVIEQHIAGIQADVTTLVEPPAHDISQTPFISKAINHDSIQLTTAPASVTDGFKKTVPFASTNSQQDDASISGNVAIKEPFQTWDQSVTIKQSDTTGIHDQVKSQSSGEESTATAGDMESFMYEQPERLTHEEWVRQQRQIHERWLEAIEQRREDTFDTRKASQPYSHHESAVIEERTSM
jgi:hypothetical protein